MPPEPVQQHVETVPVDRLCLACGQREIMGRPHSVHVCWECYFLGRCDCGHVLGSPACRELHDGDRTDV